ncbi:MAG: ParB N-terminal domain-containing protein [Chloroflexota bacterium]
MGRMKKKKDELHNPFANNVRDKGEAETDNFPAEITNEYLTSQLLGIDLPGIEQQANQKPPRIELIAIDSISPDRSQPRRVIPQSVRGNRVVSAANLPGIFGRWLEAASEGRAEPLTRDVVETYLRGGETARDTAEFQQLQEPSESEDAAAETANTDNPVERSLMQLIELAMSIREKGLMNPITVAPTGNGYVIETGERRWIAYHLLRYYIGVDDSHSDRGDLKWDQIPAVNVGEMDVWRQAYENNARNNLNAIGKARQLAILLMHLYPMDDFQPINEFGHERDFYGQVADGNTYRVPRGKGKYLVSALNLKSTKQLRDYRGLLKAPHRLWDEADENDYGEGTIRQMMDTAPDGTVRANVKIPDHEQPGDTAPVGTVWEDDDPMPKKIAAVRDFYSEKKLHRMSAEERQDVIDSLSAVLTQLKRQHKNISKKET